MAGLLAIASLSSCGQPEQAEELPPAPPPPQERSNKLQTFAWNCLTNGYVVTDYRQADNAMWLFLPGSTTLLPRKAAASGAKYSNGEFTFWSNANEAILTTPEGDDHCVENRKASILEDAKLRGVDFRGFGNEPGWVLEISANQMVFITNYGEDSYEFTVTGHEMEPGSRVVTYTSSALGKDIAVKIIGDVCQDTMEDKAYETGVEVEFDGNTYKGCGLGLH